MYFAGGGGDRGGHTWISRDGPGKMSLKVIWKGWQLCTMQQSILNTSLQASLYSRIPMVHCSYPWPQLHHIKIMVSPMYAAAPVA